VIGRSSACGKVILLGEHFVVHGAPAIALPLPGLRATVEATRIDGSCSRIEPGPAPGAARLLDRALSRLGLPPGGAWRLRVRSEIPVAEGLGSSAAFVAALIGALACASGRRLAPGELEGHVQDLERLTHGNPSGVDAAVVSHERPVWFVRGRAPRPLAVGAGGLSLVLASSGDSRSTERAVAAVAAAREADRLGFASRCAEAGELARSGRRALRLGEARGLGGVMNAYHGLLRAIGVSTPSLDALVERARRAGAAGAKLTGAGMGGFAVALVEDSAALGVARALERSGSPRVLRVPLETAASTATASGAADAGRGVGA
jgi:mevalonate kinase